MTRRLGHVVCLSAYLPRLFLNGTYGPWMSQQPQPPAASTNIANKPPYQRTSAKMARKNPRQSSDFLQNRVADLTCMCRQRLSSRSILRFRLRASLPE